MGRIKTKLIKRITRELMKKYPEQVCDNFEQNKGKVNVLIKGYSKKLRNVIAGYATRLKNSKEFSS